MFDSPNLSQCDTWKWKFVFECKILFTDVTSVAPCVVSVDLFLKSLYFGFLGAINIEKKMFL